MPSLTPAGQQKIDELAQRYYVSSDAVLTLLQALRNGNGTMAQFNHRELGGFGQWLAGGMTMIGDMFNQSLAAKVNNLCTELSQLMFSHQLELESPPISQIEGRQYTQSSSSWWPSGLGSPTASGAQNNMRYAYFANSRRLVIDNQGQISVYDTLDHQIGGVSQQQGMNSDLTFSSQYGIVNTINLPLISGPGTLPVSSPLPNKVDNVETQRGHETLPVSSPLPNKVDNVETQQSDIFVKIERLAELKQKGIISAEEYATKKAELLSRL